MSEQIEQYEREADRLREEGADPDAFTALHDRTFTGTAPSIVIPVPANLDALAESLAAGGVTVHRCGYAVGFPAHSSCRRIGVVPVRVNETGEVFHTCKVHARITRDRGAYLIHDGQGRRFASDTVTVGDIP